MYYIHHCSQESSQSGTVSFFQQRIKYCVTDLPEIFFHNTKSGELWYTVYYVDEQQDLFSISGV